MNMIPVLSDRLPVAPVPVQGKPNRILVVDDDSRIRGLERAILQRAGHHVDTATDGEIAWRALVASNYDLLLTDYCMPRVSGLELVRQVRVAQLALPVVMVSGSLASLDTATLIHDPWARIDAFVHKPFTVVELLTAVNNVLFRGVAGARSRQPALA